MTQQLERATDAADKNRARAQARMAFLLGLRARGISDVAVLRALEVAPRESFVPRQYADLAWRDIALPIACGQTMPEPWLVARMMEALSVARTHRALEIGSGSGYATAILAQLAGEVVSFERYRSLAVEARTRLESLGFHNAAVNWDDGLAAAASAGRFDRILVHGCIEAIPQALADVLNENGVIVAVRPSGRLRRLVRHVRTAKGFDETDIAACRTGPLSPGRSDFL
ncbi:MAG: protein-L-isoaspartate(D-aspartate) O-methyltransferase [Beijerinckiaceae bacterium]|nr:protein-L-isoaspartate(D-aspartate) O-methyltransferase [Beijerinckiaceae bacterium]